MEHSLASYTKILWKKIKLGWSLDIRSLSLFRIGLSLVIIGDLLLRSRYIVEHYTDLGVYPRQAYFGLWEGATSWTLHTANGQLWFQILIFSLHILLALWLLVGYRTKVATIWLWVLTVSLQNRNMGINSGADDLLRMVIFWSMFLPLDRHWAWSKMRYSFPSLKYICTIGTIAFILQQVFLYWVTAYLKLWPEWYRSHSAVYEILSLETFRLPFGDILYSYPGVMRWISWMSMVTEFVGPVLLIFPFFHNFSRILGITIIALLHLGIMTNIGVGIFPFVSIIALIPFIPRKFWDSFLPRFAPGGKVTVYYDDKCTFCACWVRILQIYWLFVGVTYIPISQGPTKMQRISVKYNAWIIGRGIHFFPWYDGFVELLKQSYLWRIFVWPLSWGLSLIIGRKIYKLISGHREHCALNVPVLEAPERRFSKILWVVICSISLYCVIAMNISVMNCGRNWWAFFRTWPLSAMSLVRERNTHVFEDTTWPVQSGWIGSGFLAPKRPSSCDIAEGMQFNVIKNHPLLSRIFQMHTSFLRSWNFTLRIDQFWGMFAPDPANVDYWFVIDGKLVSRDHPDVSIRRDLWKDYALGDDSDGKISFEKPADLHTLSISDRWRKYVYNIMGELNQDAYKRYLAESLCKRYNKDPKSPYVLEKFTIYGLSQYIRPGYLRSNVGKNPLWQHCCLQSGCFNEDL